MSRRTTTSHRTAYTSSTPTGTSTPNAPLSTSSTPVLLPNAHASGSLSSRSAPFSRLNHAGGGGSGGPGSFSGASSNGPVSRRGTPGGMSSTSAQDTFSESPYGGNASRAYASGHEVERQNDDKLEGLLGKVKMLKDITVGIGDEVRQSNMELGTMNDAFSSTSNLLGGTFKRMNAMASRQGSSWCWFMLFLILVLWIFIVVWFKRKIS